MIFFLFLGGGGGGDWHNFLTKSVGLKAFLAFYQFVTDNIFEKLVKLEFLSHS